MKSINPANGERLRDYPPHSDAEIDARIQAAENAFGPWRDLSFAERGVFLNNAAAVLRERKAALAALMTDEMGKLLRDGEAEIEKCALACEYYAEHAAAFLAEEIIPTDARKSFVSYRPLGVLLAIMPWNFPFWQAFRFAAPHLMAGNTAVLKHASNVCGCALAIEDAFRAAGLPEGVFAILLVPSEATDRIIAHPAIRAVSLTGSVAAGKSVAARAGAMLKKTVLELGGSDAYVILADADVEKAALECAKSRLLNAGQSCISAKRFIVVDEVRERFTEGFLAYFRNQRMGDPKDSNSDMGPMARIDLRDQLHEQVQRSISRGAKLLLGGAPASGPGAYYPPTVLSQVRPGMAAFDEELFGPVAAIVRAKDENEAFELANGTEFGLGSAVFTRSEQGEMLARDRLVAGQAFVNALVRSDPRLPFGGIKSSGYGRELGALGIREFVNAKTVYVA